MDIRITRDPSRVPEIDEETDTELREVYTSLLNLPNTEVAIVDFESVEEANQFIKVARAWAAKEEVKFLRKGGDRVKTMPKQVSFRLYPGQASRKTATATK